MLAVLAFVLAQAALPPPGQPYDARTDYHGPGWVCGAAFAVRLRAGETAVLTKPSAIDGAYSFATRDGAFSVHESQYATDGGTVVRRLPAGVLRRKRQDGQFVWTYRDSAPGSTDVYGPAVNRRAPGPALNRIAFGSPPGGFADGLSCLDGVGSDRR